MLLGRIGYRDGWMCAVIGMPGFDEPMMVTNWWPIERVYPGEREVLDLTGARCELYPEGRVIFKMGTSPTALWGRERHLADGGKTLPIHTENIPIPPPKVRKGIETRYHAGNWHKKLKSGWTYA